MYEAGTRAAIEVCTVPSQFEAFQKHETIQVSRNVPKFVKLILSSFRLCFLVLKIWAKGLELNINTLGETCRI